ncbi:MAG: hypothetical protein ABW166_11535 [Sedimenticola sp.]
MRRTLAIIMCMFLSGCAAMEYLWLVPRNSMHIEIPSHILKAEALNLFGEVAIKRLTAWGERSVTYLNEDEGVIEIGYWRKTNIAGYAARSEIKDNGGKLYFSVKGAGPYYSELPVEQASKDIHSELSKRFSAVLLDHDLSNSLTRPSIGRSR